MKRNLFAVLTGALGAGALVATLGAQSAPSTTAARSASVTVTGCLTQGSSPSIFILQHAKADAQRKTDPGMDYLVVSGASTVKLAANVNHEVTITGAADMSANASPKAGQKTGERDLPTLEARNLTSIADSCAAG